MDIIRILKKKIGTDFRFTMNKESEKCVELDLTNSEYYFHGLIRRHSKNDKKEILKLISSLSNLKYLDLRRNKLGILPNSFANLTNLEYLDLGSNDLGEIPNWIANMVKLTYFNVGVNQLETIPVFFKKFNKAQ